MKSIVTVGPDSVDKPFPKLMNSTRTGGTTGLILLMIASEKGIVVGNPDYERPLGFFSKWHTPNLTDYTGTVTLSND